MALMDGLTKLACLLSMISVCMNTPSTIAAIPALQYILLVVDISCTLFFTFDAYQKVPAPVFLWTGRENLWPTQKVFISPIQCL